MKHHAILVFICLFTAISGCIHFPDIFEEENDPEEYTEFYLLGPEKEVRDYPANFNVSSSQLVYVGVTNREGKDRSYSLEISLNETSNGYDVLDLEGISISNLMHPEYTFDIDNGERIEIPCVFKIEEIGEFSLNFFLLLDDEIFRELRLQIQVN